MSTYWTEDGPMAKKDKALVDQHFLVLKLPFTHRPKPGRGATPRYDYQNFLLVILLGYTPKKLEELTGYPERSLRRWLSGERKKNADVYRALQLVIERSRNTLRTLSQHQAHNKWQRFYRHQLVDLANLCDVALTMPHPESHAERQLADYYLRKAGQKRAREEA